MRNYSWLIIGFGLLGFYFFYVGIWKPDYVVMEHSGWGDGMALGLIGFWASVYLGMVAKKHSDHIVSYAYYTDVMDTEPLDSVVLLVRSNDEKIAPQKFSFDLHAANGCKPLMTRGGGTSGLIVARRDLKEFMYGDNTNMKIHGAPEMYKMGAGPGDKYRDLSGLPKEIFDMVVQSQYFSPRGVVLFFADPISDDARKEMDKLRGLPYKDLYEQANIELTANRTQISRLLNTNTMLTSAHKKAVSSFGGEKQSFEERRKDREERDEFDERR